MQKYAITSLIIAIMATPAMATSGLVTETNNGCDSTTLNTYAGDVNLSADWSPNNIILKWYNDNLEYSQNTCEYSGNIALPTNAPTKTGYTFAGWRIRTVFDIRTLENATISVLLARNRYDQTCMVTDEEEEYAEYMCVDERFSHLTDGEWSINFINTGTLKGESICSITQGTSQPQTGTPDETTSGESCWCRASGFAETGSNTYQPILSASWVFTFGNGNWGGCVYNCAYDCANHFSALVDFRRAILGISPVE